MRAMVLEQVGPIDSSPLRLMELPDPHPGPGQVRIRVRCCAICRTDLHVIEGELARQKRPVVPGHQAVGIVDELGEGCTTLKLGQRVGIAWLRGTCGRCEYCRGGRENLCRSTRFTGYHEDGGYAQYAVVREDFAYPIPEGFEDAQATPLLCGGIIGYRALQQAHVPPGGRLALYGFGSSAHIVIQLARHRGQEVYVVTRGEKHRALAAAMGAAWVGENSRDLPVKVHSAILFAPAGELVPQALESLDRGGTLALAGIYMSPTPPLDYDKHLFYERSIQSVTCNTRGDGHGLLREAAEIPIRPHTAQYPLDQANRALQDLKHDCIQGTGVLTVE